MKKIVFIVIISLVFISCFAGSSTDNIEKELVTVSGQIIYKNKPVEGIHLYINSEKITETNDNGHFVITNNKGSLISLKSYSDTSLNNLVLLNKGFDFEPSSFMLENNLDDLIIYADVTKEPSETTWAYINKYANTDLILYNVDVGETEKLQISYGNDIYYLKPYRKQYEYSSQDFVSAMPFQKNNQFKISVLNKNVVDNNYVKIGEQTLSLEYKIRQIEGEGIVASISDEGIIAFHNEGQVVVQVYLEENVGFELGIITVKESKYPTYYGEESEFVKQYGFPDVNNKIYIPWYEKYQNIDGLWCYNPGYSSVQNGLINHWIYNDSPYLVLDIGSFLGVFEIENIYTVGWD